MSGVSESVDNTSTPSILSDTGAIQGLAEQWAEAAAAAPYHTMGFTDYQEIGKAPGVVGHRILVYPRKGNGELVAPCVLGKRLHSFTVGERHLVSVPVTALNLNNPWLLESHSEKAIAKALQFLLFKENADLLSLGEIPESSNLRAALRSLVWPSAGLALSRKESLRWLIDLPQSFDEYLAGLTSSTRQSTKRKLRKLEKTFDVKVELITKPSQINRFLEQGEKISRLTYQWNVGQRLENDENSQSRFIKLAEQGRLRCYLLSLDGEVRAFLRGTVEGPIYHYETPGFDPEFRKTSIGTILLVYVLQDLIENTSCRIFDFGVGGDEVSYKSTYGTRHLRCNSYCVVRFDRPRSVLIWLGQHAINKAKDAADLMLRHERLRRFIKKSLRQYGP